MPTCTYVCTYVRLYMYSVMCTFVLLKYLCGLSNFLQNLCVARFWHARFILYYTSRESLSGSWLVWLQMTLASSNSSLH